MSRANLKTKRALWRRRELYRLRKWRKYRRANPSRRNLKFRKKWWALYDRARDKRREFDAKLAEPIGISNDGVELIASFEGFVDHPYNDPAGHATIGFGHLIHLGPVTNADRRKWGIITRAEGKRLLLQDLAKYEQAVRKLVKVPLSQSEFDALVSFTFNVGPNALASSTLLRKLNAGNKRGAADEFLRWNKAGGKVLPGLTRRREAERRLFVS